MLLDRNRAAQSASNDATSIRFYRIHRSVLPVEQGVVVRRELFAEMPSR